MSIARAGCRVLKVRRTLMSSAALRVPLIKDLKDLRILRGRANYRHAGPKGPEEVFHVNDRGGQAPALRARKGVRLAISLGI